MSPSKEIKVASVGRRSSLSSGGSSGYFSSSPTLGSSPPVLCNPKSGECKGDAEAGRGPAEGWGPWDPWLGAAEQLSGLSP